MAKWFGQVGFSTPVETGPGVWVDQVVARPYYGDVIRSKRRIQSSDKLNDDITLSNEISIIADPFANENFHMMCYVELMGTKWVVESVEPAYPRIILSVGGVYNG